MDYKTLKVDGKELLRMNLQTFSDGGEGGDTGNAGEGGEGGQQQEPLTLDAVQKMIQSETDKVRSKLHDIIKEKDNQLEALKNEKLTDDEKKALKEQEYAKNLADREQALRLSENKHFATQSLISEGLNPKWLDLVTGAGDERTTQLIALIKEIKAEDDEKVLDTYRQSTGRHHQQGSQGGVSSLAAQLAEKANNHGATTLNAWGKK